VDKPEIFACSALKSEHHLPNDRYRPWTSQLVDSNVTAA
jgi:hypothetical protein